MAEIDRSFGKRLQARKQVQEIERANRYLEGEGLRSLSVEEKENLLPLLEQPQSKGELVPVQEPTTPSGLQSILSVLKKKLPGGPAAALAKLVGPSIENKKVFRKRMEEAVKEAEESDKPLEDIMPFGDKIGVSLRAILELYNKGMTRREALKTGAGAAARAIAPPLPGLPKKGEAELQNRGKELARSFMDDIGYQWLIGHDPKKTQYLESLYLGRLAEQGLLEDFATKGGVFSIPATEKKPLLVEEVKRDVILTNKGSWWRYPKKETGTRDIQSGHAEYIPDWSSVQEEGEVADIIKNNPEFRKVLRRINPDKGLPSHNPSREQSWNFLDSPDWLLRQNYMQRQSFRKDHFFFSKKVKELQDMGYSNDDIKKLFKIGMEHYQKDLPKKNTGGVIRNPYDGYSPRAI